MFKGTLVLIFTIILSFLCAQSVDWQWATTATGSSTEQGWAITIDNAGNSYVAGHYYGDTTFGSTTLICSGARDVFIGKMDPTGHWLWVKKAGGSQDDNSTSMALDSAGNIYLTGNSTGETIFGWINLPATNLGASDGFVAKLDNDGNWLWAVKTGGIDHSYSNSIALDSVGNAYITGDFYTSVSFGTMILPNNGAMDAFIAKLDSNGNWLWAKQAGGTNYDQGKSIATDFDGNCYVAGDFRDTVIFGSDTLSTSNAWDTDIFAAKLDTDGNWLWVTQGGNSNGEQSRSIDINNAGEAYVMGTFYGSTQLGATSLNSNGAGDFFIAKLDNQGNWLWARGGGGTEYDFSNALAIDGNNNLYVCGYFQGTATYGSSTITGPGYDVFVVKADSLGNWLWAKKGGGVDYDTGLGIAVDNNGSVYLTGSFRYAADFGYLHLTAENNSDNMYVAKLAEVTQAPAPAIALQPGNNAVSVLPSANLNWQANISVNGSDIPSGFKICLGTDNPPTNIVDSLDLGGQLSYNPSPDLELNTTYYWSIVPYNMYGDAVDCPVWSFQTYYYDVLQYPVGGETWLAGTTRTITWSTANPPPMVALSISFDNGSQWYNIGSVNGSLGYYHYQVPVLNSTLCRIKLSSVDNPALNDISNAFRISTSSTLPKLVLTYPTTNAVHTGVGQEINITWTRQNVSSVALDYSTDNGVNWTEISTGLSVNSYMWNVPDTPSANCRIRVRSELNSDVYDISDNIFSIGKIQVITPNGGEIITGDYSGFYIYNITWNAPGVTNVRIDYGINSYIWSNIVASYPAGFGNYYAVIPGEPTSEGLIRISNADNQDIYDISDSTFSIRNPIKLLNANGGGFVTNTSLFEITWQNQAVNPNWQIWWEYSFDNMQWTRINSSAVPVTDQSMLWFVTTGEVNQMWLRTMEMQSYNIIGKSENPFRVTEKVLVLHIPNGGESYIGQSNQEINWDAYGLDYLNIDLSINNGVTWNRIASHVEAGLSSYNWLVPDTPSANCRIRLSSVEYDYMHIESAQNFAIEPFLPIAPTVSFTGDILTGEIPLTVQFTSNINPGSGSIDLCWWEFGDGLGSSETNPYHIYTVPGTYSVSLKITNAYALSDSFIRVDYVTATPHYPFATLTTSPIMSFGMVPVGQVSELQFIEIGNMGTAPMLIDSVSFLNPLSNFSSPGITLPQLVPIGQSIQIPVLFTPTVYTAVYDNIRIDNNSVNQPVIMIELIGNVEVPLSTPENVLITIEDPDAMIEWDEVTTTIFGAPAEPDTYLVLYSEAMDEDTYWFLGSTDELSYTHSDVAMFRDNMFYKVLAVKFNNRNQENALAELTAGRSKVSWKELQKILK